MEMVRYILKEDIYDMIRGVRQVQISLPEGVAKRSVVESGLHKS